ncbi:serine hydrolase domain-containing protein [Mycetocola zhujimingii]|uniref:serine hydrolase domain-containing protein n=1 Tax=Mycetocola zhujimingii TaxID=2079792 RepID=UPI0018E08BD2|nr:serine hydrolase domain-containing protein [Mycetocola zhujimingii]
MSMNQQESQNTVEPAAIQPSRRRGVIIATTSVLAVGALVAGAWGAGAWSDAAPVEKEATAKNSVIQEHLDDLVDLGFPAALASFTNPDGEHEDYVAGVGNLTTDEPVPVDGEVRMGSNTKTFTSVAVLQLVEDGQVALDEPIDTYLPGLVTGDGVDGTRITVRHLLQQMSGLPEYADEIAMDFEKVQSVYTSPRDLLDIALSKPAGFAAGERWEYSNTNYLVLGLLIERVAERPLFEVITERIIEPLGLEHTYFPTVGEKTLRGEHPSGYHINSDGDFYDVSALDPSWGWAAGQIVASPSDLNEFTRAVLDGRLLGEEMTTEMQKTVPAEEGLWPGAGYGLGLQSYPLSCGGVIWGHGGDIHGFQTRNGVASDGTAFTVAVTALPWAFIAEEDEPRMMDTYKAVTDAVDAAFCED